MLQGTEEVSGNTQTVLSCIFICVCRCRSAVNTQSALARRLTVERERLEKRIATCERSNPIVAGLERLRRVFSAPTSLLAVDGATSRELTGIDEPARNRIRPTRPAIVVQPLKREKTKIFRVGLFASAYALAMPIFTISEVREACRWCERSLAEI